MQAFNKENLKTTLVCSVICIYHELSGINVVLAYSSTIIGNISKDINAKVSSAVIGFMNFFAAFISIWVLRLATHKTIMLIGHFFIGLTHLGVVVSVIYSWNYYAVLFMVLFLFAYELSTGPIAFIHCTEVASDVGLGISLLALNLTIVVLNLVSDPLMADKNFGVVGVFGTMGALSFTGTLFIWLYMRGTEGLTDIEKKTLYMPAEIRDRKRQEAELRERHKGPRELK